LDITALEEDLNTLSAALEIFGENTLEADILSALRCRRQWRNGRVKIRLLLGDARQNVPENSSFSVIFMDGFSPDVNPELWSFDFVKQLVKILEPDGVIATYSAAFPLRGALLKAGLKVAASRAFGRRRGGTVAAFDDSAFDGMPLSEKELNIILKSTAGVPYFDHGLNNCASDIIAGRRRLIQRLRRYNIPKWYK
jgi:hypothetical protein